MDTESWRHEPVMADEVMEVLRVRPEGTYCDLTVGLGGHAVRIARQLTSGRLIALDRDPYAVEIAQRRLASFAQVSVVHANYSRLSEILESFGITSVAGILLDAGVSSMQLDDAGRGFSFQQDGPLDMRMDTTEAVNALEWLERATAHEVEDVLRRYGDVGPAKRIAREITRRRDAGHLKRTADLAEAVGDALSFVHGAPAEIRTVFMALRMAVNAELQHMEAGLQAAVKVLAPGGRLVAITFHSGEDRLVKNRLRAYSRTSVHRLPDGRDREKHPPLLRLLTVKPLLPSLDEQKRNPRSQSARMRAAERLIS